VLARDRAAAAGAVRAPGQREVVRALHVALRFPQLACGRARDDKRRRAVRAADREWHLRCNRDRLRTATARSEKGSR
jgi:hypothetical protein